MPAPRKRHPGSNPMGAPSLPYNEVVADLFLERMEAGEPISTICGTNGIPSWPTIRKWKRVNPEFASQYALAREASAESCEMNAISEAQAAVDGESAQVARIRVDTWKWAASKRNPRAYGDKMDINVSGTLTLEGLIRQSITTPITQAIPTIEHDPDAD